MLQIRSSRLHEIYDRYIGYGMALAIDVSDIEPSALAVKVSASTATMLAQANDRSYVQVYCNTPSSQVIDPQYTTNYIPTKVIEDEDLPYRLAVGA